MKRDLKKLISINNINLEQAIRKINKNGKKSLIIVDKNNKLKGVLTDGDIRHAIKKKIDLNTNLSKIYNKKPIYYETQQIKNLDIKKIFLKNKIFVLPIVNIKKEIMDVIFLDDFLKKIDKKNKKIQGDVFIMAGGLGKRLRPITEILPKPLIPVNGLPIIQKIIQDFENYKINNYFISLNYKSSILKAFLNELSIKKKFTYVNENKPLGTSGAIKKVENIISENFFLINADIYIDTDLKKIFDFHKKNINDLTVVAISKKITIPYGNCEYDKDNNLINIHEKPKINLSVNSGIYVCNKKIINLIPKNSFQNMDDLIKKCIKKKYKVRVYDLQKSNWTDIGEWSQYNSLISNNV